MKPRGSMAAAQPPARKTGSTPAACVESPQQLVTWKPTHTSRIRSDELVIVLKPKITINLHAAFGLGGIDTAEQRFPGSITNSGAETVHVSGDHFKPAESSLEDDGVTRAATTE
ncbi:hypothetical protein MRX96_047807 [Rhipicephalus microplus]